MRVCRCNLKDMGLEHNNTDIKDKLSISFLGGLGGHFIYTIYFFLANVSTSFFFFFFCVGMVVVFSPY